MSKSLSKEEMLFEFDENGDLIPQIVTLDLLDEKPEVKVRPLSRGEWLKLLQMEDAEQDIYILEHALIEPKLTREDYARIKPKYQAAINSCVTALTLDLKQDSVNEALKRQLTEVEEVVLEKKDEPMKTD